MARRVALYARVSTGGQSVDNQLAELLAVADRSGWQVVETYADRGISGTKGRLERPAFDEMLKAVVRHEFDAVAAWSVDRLGRSMSDLVAVLGELKGAGVDLYLHRQALDTATPSGRMLYHMLGAFAEFEAELIRDRVRSGIARARASGTKLGRPTVPRAKVAAVQAELRRGTGVHKAARLCGVGSGTVQRIRREMATPASG